MGHYSAINIHQDMLKHRYGQIPTYEELSEFPNIMGLAVGKKAVVYDSTNGTASGEDLMASYFGNDLANSSKCHLHVVGFDYADSGRSLLELHEAWTGRRCLDLD